MARGRLISKSLGSSRKFHALLTTGGKLGEFCQVLFPLLVANTDDYGRMAGDAFTVKNVVLPSSQRQERDFAAALDVMHSVGIIIRYAVKGSEYLQVVDFDAHQPNLHKRIKAKFPEPPEISGEFRNAPDVSSEAPETPLQSNPEPRTQNPEGNPEPRTALTRRADALFEQFWTAYPRKKAKDAARTAWNKRRPTDDLLRIMLDALALQARSVDWLKDGGKYIPHPATWINGARWTDVVDVDVGPDGLSERMRGNAAAGAEFLRLVQQG